MHSKQFYLALDKIPNIMLKAQIKFFKRKNGP